jgi:hypothetical protein
MVTVPEIPSLYPQRGGQIREELPVEELPLTDSGGEV